MPTQPVSVKKYASEADRERIFREFMKQEKYIQQQIKKEQNKKQTF